ELVSLQASERSRTRRASRPRNRSTDPAAAGLADRVGEHLDTRVHVELGRAKGRLVIEVADIDDLARVVQIITG
ncbi:MAG TPA: chromosome partitioning protein ParB, partial [Mycobacteriales bacterium]|nr:chromosome partitioning protein ParB [Mycobacteriales bacterium]